MGLEINGFSGANRMPQNSNQNGYLSKFSPQKKSVFVMNQNGSQTEKIYVNGKLQTSVIRFDKNGDGKFDNNEMTTVDRYYYNDDGTATVRRFQDDDGDGYNDTVTTYEYDKNGKIKSQKTEYEEDINDVLKRFHLDHETYNRSMTAHKDGIYLN